eukprot:IDg12451t1
MRGGRHRLSLRLARRGSRVTARAAALQTVAMMLGVRAARSSRTHREAQRRTQENKYL